MPDIHCKSCEKLIHAGLDDEKGIQSVSVSLEKKEAEITYDEKTISKKTIMYIISDTT